MKIRSPVTKARNTELVGVLDTNFVIDSYKRQLDIDVRRIFKGVKKIQIYVCLDTGYRFYYPFAISGDSKFYEYLEKFPWYYMNWKWEHEIAGQLIKKGNNVLEIGCGKGSFLEKIQYDGVHCTGLEINESAAKHSQDKRLKIINRPIELFAKNHTQQYDFVCAFQVLEHIANVYNFLKAAVQVLKPGANLVISVPNNDSLIFKTNQKLILNMPPHHMGLWDIKSLIKIQEYFGLRIESIQLEPLQEYHQGYAKILLNDNISTMMHKKLGFLSNYLRKPIAEIIGLNIATISPYINGHTILVVYSKRV